MPRSEFIGRGSGGPAIGNKMKVVIAYLMHKKNLNYNDYCVEIPKTYKPLNIDFNNFDEVLLQKKDKTVGKKSRLLKAMARRKVMEDSDSETEVSSTKRRLEIEEDEPEICTPSKKKKVVFTEISSQK